MTVLEPGSAHPAFPTTRLRRLRYQPAVRRLVQETRLSAANFVLPLFVRPGRQVRNEVSAMPGNFQLSPDLLVEELRAAADLGLGGVLLFGIPAEKDAVGSDAVSDSGIIAQAVRAAKQALPELLIITDVCFCEYTDHGHCGPIGRATGRTDVDNDATLELLARQAVVHARAGADIVAPSGMMDGMVGAIRGGLDAAGFAHVPILSYAAKYAERLLRPVPRGGRERAQVRRPSRLSDGPRSGGRPGDAGDRTRSGRRGRHDHGQARPALPGHYSAGRRPFPRRAAGGLQRVGRVQHGRGGRPAGLARWAGRRDGVSDRDPPGRGEHHLDLLGEEGRRMAGIANSACFQVLRDAYASSMI